MNPFVKSHALGNDYIVVDPAKMSFALTPEAIRKICHRRFGIGSDGILAHVPSHNADFGLRIYNPDGSEAEKSGNGLRIFAKYLYEHGHTRKTRFTVETLGGTVTCALDEMEDNTVRSITVEMGEATFHSDRIPATGPAREVVDEELEAAGQHLRVTAVNVGNPHCVVFTENLGRLDFYALGPALEQHPLFPQRTNVQFAQVLSSDRVRIRIWERGAGETMASGTSASAVAAACVRRGLTGQRVEVEMDGGVLGIEVGEGYALRMTGPASEVYVGEMSDEFVETL